MAGAAAAAAAISNIISDVGNLGVNIYNAYEQHRVNQRNEEMMYESWARDDTARQRMVQDLESAGLSKWLAAGASPSTSSPISLSAPNMANFKLDALQHAFQNNLAEQQTEAQTQLQSKQGELADASTAVAEAEQKIKEEELKIKQQELRKVTHDADVWTNRPGIASNDPAPMKYFGEGANLLSGNSKAGGRVGQAAKQLVDVAAKTSPGAAAVVGGFKAGRAAVDWLKGKLSGEDKIKEQPKKQPLNYNQWLKVNGKKRSEESSRQYDEYFNNFYK